MKVNIEEIQKITLQLLKRLQKSQGGNIYINSDFYWDISEEELYNPYKEPKNISLGQLSDDLEEIQKLGTSNYPISYGLKKIASILKVLSIENSAAF